MFGSEKGNFISKFHVWSLHHLFAQNHPGGWAEPRTLPFLPRMCPSVCGWRLGVIYQPLGSKSGFPCDVELTLAPLTSQEKSSSTSDDSFSSRTMCNFMEFTNRDTGGLGIAGNFVLWISLELFHAGHCTVLKSRSWCKIKLIKEVRTQGSSYSAIFF